MPETHVVEYQLTEDQAAAAADAVLDSLAPGPGEMRLRGIVLRSVGYGVLAAVGIAVGVVWGLPWWLFIGPALILALVVFVLASTWWTATVLKRPRLDAAIREAFRRLESPRIRWTVTDDRLTVESGQDVREFRWADMTDVFLTGTFWILKIRNAPTMLLLADRIPDAAARFLLTRARDVGATIRVAGKSVGVDEAV